MAKTSITNLFNDARSRLLSALEFFQRPLPLTIFAFLAGVIGVFYFAQLLVLCEIILIWDLWAFGKSREKSYSYFQYFLFIVTSSACLWAACYGLEKYKNEAAEQRLQTMFAADLTSPLTDIYAVLKLDRIMEPSELKSFSFIIMIEQTNEAGNGKSVALSVNTLSKQPVSWPNVVPGMQVQAVLYPPATELENIFVWDYYSGLDRIELGGYRNISGAPKTLADLNKSFVQIVGTDPVNQRISEIMIVANRWVILDLFNADFSWRQANKGDFGGMNLEGTVNEWRAVQSFQLTSLDFSDLVAKRRPPAETEMPIHPYAQELRVVPGQHGWLVADKEMF